MKNTLSHTKSGLWLPRVIWPQTKRQWCLNKCHMEAMDFLCLIKISAVINKLFIFLPLYWYYKMCCHSHFHANNFDCSGSRRGRDWCHKQSPDGITHTETQWVLPDLRQSQSGALSEIPIKIPLPVIWCMKFMKSCFQQDTLTPAPKVLIQLRSGL